VPHPFHVLCEKGGKPRNPPYRNSENALRLENKRRFGYRTHSGRIAMGFDAELVVLSAGPAYDNSALFAIVHLEYSPIEWQAESASRVNQIKLGVAQ